jgi:pimeloyl-ACP methyl ester carboxylesterase
MASSKPVIVLIHGAFHPPHAYRKLIEPLRGAGYVVLAPPMPTTGLDDTVVGKTYVEDVKRVHESLLPLLDEGQEAVLLCHSQGGIAGSAATEGQTVQERRTRNLKGGIKAIIYLAAFALPEKGLSLMAAIGGRPGSFYAEDVRENGPLSSMFLHESGAELIRGHRGRSINSPTQLEISSITTCPRRSERSISRV